MQVSQMHPRPLIGLTILNCLRLSGKKCSKGNNQTTNILVSKIRKFEFDGVQTTLNSLMLEMVSDKGEYYNRCHSISKYRIEINSHWNNLIANHLYYADDVIVSVHLIKAFKQYSTCVMELVVVQILGQTWARKDCPNFTKYFLVLILNFLIY